MAPIGEFLAAPLSPPKTGSSTGQAFISRQIQLETPPARSTRVRREQIYAQGAGHSAENDAGQPHKRKGGGRAAALFKRASHTHARAGPGRSPRNRTGLATHAGKAAPRTPARGQATAQRVERAGHTRRGCRIRAGAARRLPKSGAERCEHRGRRRRRGDRRCQRRAPWLCD